MIWDLLGLIDGRVMLVATVVAGGVVLHLMFSKDKEGDQ